MKTKELQVIDNGRNKVLIGANKPIKAWVGDMHIEDQALTQLKNVADMPFVYKHVAVMPDVHAGYGATIGSVIPTKGAVIPAAVGVDIGCGMNAVRTTLKASQLPDNLFSLRSHIEKAVPHGRTNQGGANDRGAWDKVPTKVGNYWSDYLEADYKRICEKNGKIFHGANVRHLGTLGTGNHFIEICIDEEDYMWVMLHSGSRGVGNRIGTEFIQLAKKDMQRHFINLPDMNLAYLPEGTNHFNDYIEALTWAQEFAKANRELMMEQTLLAIKESNILPKFKADLMAVNCHHNYATRENHFGSNIWVTRKGAVNARKGILGIIPGSMGAKSFIVRGLGNEESFCSCSHGAGRVMSRTAAKAKFTLKDHKNATKGVECRKDKDVIDETPMAYKDIDRVMKAQSDLVEVVHTLKQVICVKG